MYALKGRVEEWEVDGIGPAQTREALYETTINLRTGDITGRQLEGAASGEDIASIPLTMQRKAYEYTEGFLLSAYSSRSQEHADKLAVEGRQKWLRESHPSTPKEKAP